MTTAVRIELTMTAIVNRIEKFSASVVDVLEERAAVLEDQVGDERPDEAEERDADVRQRRPQPLVALRQRRLRT